MPTGAIALAHVCPAEQVARRYKIMNPEKLRDVYGKMVYILQDASNEDMIEELGFELVAPIKTVHAKLKECDALALLSDDQIATATQVGGAEGQLVQWLHAHRRRSLPPPHAAHERPLMTPAHARARPQWPLARARARPRTPLTHAAACPCEMSARCHTGGHSGPRQVALADPEGD